MRRGGVRKSAIVKIPKNIIKDKVSIDQHKIYEQKAEINMMLNKETVDANILWSEIKETINK